MSRIYAQLMDRALANPLPELRQFLDTENRDRSDSLMGMVEDACRHAYVEGCRDGYAEAVRDLNASHSHVAEVTATAIKEARHVHNFVAKHTLNESELYVCECGEVRTEQTTLRVPR